MLFAIDIAAMNGPEKVLDALDAIVARAEDEVHEIEIRDADRIEQSPWYQSSRPDRRKLLEQLAEASLHRSTRTKGPHLRRINICDPNSAASARSSAYTPLLVLLENDRSDGQLVEAAVRTFAQPVTKDLCFGPPSRLEPPSFRMESRGGEGELKKLVMRCLAEAKDRGRPARVVVVADSDGEWPGDVKRHAQAIRNDCEDAGVPCPPLNKRTAENYIPDAVWRAWASARGNGEEVTAVEALLRLSPTQRDHVHLASMGTSPWDHEKPDVAELFAGVPNADRAMLQRIDLKGKRKSMVIFALRDHGAALTREDFAARDQSGDLSEIVRQIEDEL